MKLALLSLVLPFTANAMCASPEAFVLPRPGTELPPNPTLYLFDPPDSMRRPDTTELRARTSSGATLRMNVHQLESAGELRAYRLDVAAPAGTEFHLEPRRTSTRSWKVRADVVRESDFTLKRGKDVSSSWTCSYESVRVLDSSLAAPAYRVEFAETEAELRAGKLQTVVVEGDDNDAFRFRRDVPEPPARSVRLGHHSCWGENFVWSTPKVAVRVTALLADGSERKSDAIFLLEAPPRTTAEQ